MEEDSRWRCGWFSLGESGGLGLVGWGSHRTWGSYSSLEWPRGRIYLNSLGFQSASFRTECSQIGLRDSLGIISRFRKVPEGAKHPDWGISRALGTGVLPVRHWVAQKGSSGLGFGGDGAQGEGQWHLRRWGGGDKQECLGSECSDMDLGCSQEVLRVRSPGKGGSGRRYGGSQDEYRRKVPHVGGWWSWGTQGHNLRGIFKIT